MRKYKRPFLWGVGLFGAGLFIALTGYAYVIMYLWPLLLFTILFFVASYTISKRSSIFTQYVTTFMIVTVSAITGLGLGTGVRTYQKSLLRGECDRIVLELDNYKQLHGRYPQTLDTGSLGIRSSVRFIYDEEWDGSFSHLWETNDYDMTIYLSRDKYQCMIPVTKMLLMSITRFYIFRRSVWEPEWKYDYIIWHFG